MVWLYLFAAGVLEVVWAFSMKQSEGFTRLWPSIVTVVTMLASFALLAWSMRSLPLGTLPVLERHFLFGRAVLHVVRPSSRRTHGKWRGTPNRCSRG